MTKFNEVVLWTANDDLISLNVLDDNSVEISENSEGISINAETLEAIETAMKEANRDV